MLKTQSMEVPGLSHKPLRSRKARRPSQAALAGDGCPHPAPPPPPPPPPNQDHPAKSHLSETERRASVQPRLGHTKCPHTGGWTIVFNYSITLGM